MPVSILYCRVAVSSLGAGSIRVNSNRDSPARSRISSGANRGWDFNQGKPGTLWRDTTPQVIYLL